VIACAGAGFTAKPPRAADLNVPAIAKSVLGDIQPKRGRVNLKLPKIVEDGGSVPLSLAVESPMTPENYVKSVYVFPEKNPTPVAAAFHFGSTSGKAEISTRIRLAESQQVFAIAELSDGSTWMTSVDVVVTIGGCGGVVADKQVQAPIKTRIKVPETARKGKAVQIKTIVTHPMESGHRKDAAGNPVPRKIISRFVCLYDDKEVFGADFHPSIAHNPPLFFHVLATHSGRLTLKWLDDDGSIYSDSAEIKVT
jgi:sulfur-oxidizing protein SoxY